MKISDLKERVQLIYGEEKLTEDGEVDVEWKDGKWGWASVTPKIIKNGTGTSRETYSQNKYEVVMRKNYIRYTRHALKIRLRWKHKILDLISSWQETTDFQHIYGLMMERKELQND